MTKKLNQVLAVVLTIAALMTGQVAMAANTWTVTNPTGSTFRITRPDSHVGTTETVKYRTVSLSAYAGQHYTAVSDEVTFDVNDTYKEVTVSETTPGTNAYKYQDGTKRKYRFDVTDQGGFHLAHCDRKITTGTRFTNSYVNKSVTDLVYFQSGNVMSGSGNKYLDVAHSGTNGTEKMIDDGYDTWYQYQKIWDIIRYGKVNIHSKIINYHEHCFSTELSTANEKYSFLVAPEDRLNSITKRKGLLCHPFYQRFPIVILAVGHYPREHGIDIQALFQTRWNQRTCVVGKKWYNIHYSATNTPKLLIHTNQLSMVSNELIKEIADRCIDFKEKNGIIF